MNKRFSTLLAAALVAGGFSFNAMAASTEYPIGEYVQFKVGEKFLIVGEGATRDSLALVADPTSATSMTLEGINKTLWKLNLTPVKDANGLIAKYEVSIENKMNGAIALTKAGAVANKSEFYSPGAVVASGRQVIATVSTSAVKGGKVTLDEVDFTPAAYYDATAKKVVGYQLNSVDDVIKLMTVSADAKDIKTAEELAAAVAKLTFDGTKAGITIDGNAPSTVALTASMLNAIGNESFHLFFNKDITENAKFTNPFSANELSASELTTYSAVVYDQTSYKATLKAAEKVGTDVADFKAAISAYASVAGDAINATAKEVGKVNAKAPNASDLTKATALIDATATGALFAADGASATKVAAILTAVDGISYENVAATGATEVYKVKDVKAALKKVTDACEAATKEIDKLKTADAIAKTKAAVAAFVKVAYRIDGEQVDYSTFKIDAKDAKTVLTTLAAGYADTRKAELVALVADDVVAYTASAEVTVDEYAPLEVVGQKDTYVTVDTAFVAAREKYLSLNTTKLNTVVIKTATGKAVDTTKDDYEFDATTMSKILVPEIGKWVTPTLFNMSVVVNEVAQGDSILIKAHTWNVPDNGKFYRETKDAADQFTAGKNVVIRTLGSLREASVILAGNENDDAIKNTKISFESPKMATLVKDGAIYHVIDKENASKTVGKYYVSTPSDYNTFAKEAFANVPGTQFVATKNANNYSLDNRDFAASVISGSKLFVVGDEKDMIYTTSARDTFQLVEVAAADDTHLGYKFVTEEVQRISDYVLSATNYANQDVPFFLAFDGSKDSLLVANKDQAKSLELKMMLDKDNKQVSEAYLMNDADLEKQLYQLYAKDGKDTLYLNVNDDNELVVTKVPTDILLQFRNINNEANEYEVLIGAYDAVSENYQVSKKVSYNQKGQAVAVELDEATAFAYDLKDNSTDIYKNFGLTDVTNVIISLDGDPASKVTAVHPFAIVKRTGLDLKAAATDNDFVLGLDTAYVDRKDNIRYAYYITKPIDVAKVGSFDEKAYMVTYADSIAHNSDTVKYDQDGLTRIGFVHAKRVNAFGNDSLAITKVKPAAADTINVVKTKGITPATFAFAIEGEGSYRIETAPDAAGKKYVSYLNGVLVMGNKEQAQLFNVTTTDIAPTDNETIEASSVSVIASEGQITIAGAEGKKMVISNILGQAIANTVISSSNATIAVPAGVVVVAIEGEAAVKAIVK